MQLIAELELLAHTPWFVGTFSRHAHGPCPCGLVAMPTHERPAVRGLALCLLLPRLRASLHQITAIDSVRAEPCAE